MAEPRRGTPRILIASVGVGVPTQHAGLLAGALARQAKQLGYRHVLVENDQVSAVGPEPEVTPANYGTCPDCQRKVARYPGGKLYRHLCRPRGTRRVFHLELPYVQLPLSENQRLHHQEKARRVKQLRQDAFWLARSKKIPPLTEVTVTLHWKPAVRRRRDEDNPAPTLKALCDGLVDARVVDDDTHDQMRKRVAIHDPMPGQKQTRLWLIVAGLEPAIPLAPAEEATS